MDYIEKANKLSEEIKTFLFSDQPRLEAEKVCFMYGLDENDLEYITYPMGLIFVGDVKLNDYPKMLVDYMEIETSKAFGIAFEINKRIFNKFPDYYKDSAALLEQWSRQKMAPLVSEEEAYKKVLEIEPWLLEQKREDSTPTRQMEHLNISDALVKYPNLGEQKITVNQIKLKYFPTPARPSIKNWITDFRDNMGSGKHSSIDRGNYLFHSENGKRLSSSERKRLSVILKSLDEEALLPIDPKDQRVVFESIKTGQEDYDIENKSTEKWQGGLGFQDKSAKTGHMEKRLFEQREDEIRKKTFGNPAPTFSDGAGQAKSGALQNQEGDIFQKYETYFAKERKKSVSPNFLKAHQPKVAKESDNLQKEEKNVHAGYFSSFASGKTQPEKEISSGKIDFSSPQKFAVEQEKGGNEDKSKPGKNETSNKEESVFNPSVISFPRANKKSQWQIKPRNFDNNGNSMKISGNVIDLRS